MAWSKDHSKRAMIAAEMAEAERLKTEAEREATELVKLETIAVMNANRTKWLPAVDTIALRDSTYPNPENGDTVRITGEASVYRFDSESGWVKTDEYNPVVVDSLMAHMDVKASKTTYGHVKIGDGLRVADGVVSAEASAVQDASVTEKGIVQLDDSTDSTSTIKAATPNAVNKVRQLLSNVANYAVATAAEAKAGIVNNKYMTPLRTKEAIADLAPKPIVLSPGPTMITDIGSTPLTPLAVGATSGDVLRWQSPLGGSVKVFWKAAINITSSTEYLITWVEVNGVRQGEEKNVATDRLINTQFTQEIAIKPGDKIAIKYRHTGTTSRNIGITEGYIGAIMNKFAREV